MWIIAVKTLLADRGKLLTALVGVIFSVVLVNVQGGLFLGLLRQVSLLVDHSNADIWVGHRRIHNVDFPEDIPRRWIHRLRGIPGVKRAEPYLIGFSSMALPDGGFESIVVVGSDPASLLGTAWVLEKGRIEDLLQPDGIIVDVYDHAKLDDPQIGELREIAGRRARVVAMSHGITGFLVAPYVFTTLDRAAAYVGKPEGVCSYFLLQLEDGTDVESVCRLIQQRVPDLDAMPRSVYGRMSIDFWMTRTGLGISFGAATVLGLLVGLVVVGQTLYASVLDRLTEYAALKALGADDKQIHRILFLQATLMAVGGSLLGLLLVIVIHAGFASPRVPILVPWWLSLGSCALVLGICLISSLLPYTRVRKVDPMVVLQG